MGCLNGQALVNVFKLKDKEEKQFWSIFLLVICSLVRLLRWSSAKKFPNGIRGCSDIYNNGLFLSPSLPRTIQAKLRWWRQIDFHAVSHIVAGVLATIDDTKTGKSAEGQVLMTAKTKDKQPWDWIVCDNRLSRRTLDVDCGWKQEKRKAQKLFFKWI